MAFYASYNEETVLNTRLHHAGKGLQERVPLAAIDGNRRPHPKDLPDPTICFNLSEACKPSLPFAIFSDETDKVEEEQENAPKCLDKSRTRAFADLFDNNDESKISRPFAIFSDDFSQTNKTEAENKSVNVHHRTSTAFWDLFDKDSPNPGLFPKFSEEFCKTKIEEPEKKSAKVNDTPRSAFADLFDFDASNKKAFPPPPPIPRRVFDYGKDFPYKVDFLKHLKELELRLRINPYYMKLQDEIDSNMRHVLVDWMVEVGLQFEYCSDTIHLAVLLTDRFLSLRRVAKSNLQLVGITSIFIAAKYEEVLVQDLAVHVWITDNTYSKKTILKMEQILLETLNCSLGAPTALTFLNFAFHLTQTSKKVLYLGQYLCELALLEDKPFLRHLQSCIGLGAYCLSRHMHGYKMWPMELQITGYGLENVKTAMDALFEQLRRAYDKRYKSPNTVQVKYSTSEYMKVSEMAPPDSIKYDQYHFGVRITDN